MATLGLPGSFLEQGAYYWGPISSGDGKLTEAIANGGRAPEEDCVGNLIVYQKRRHPDEHAMLHLCRYQNRKASPTFWFKILECHCLRRKVRNYLKY